MTIEREEFEYVSTLVRSDAGLVLEKGKEYLVEARLRPLAQEAGLTSVQAFIQQLRTPGATMMRRRTIEAMTTNETSFFRDLHPFESLRKTVLPRIIESRRDERRLFIWSAACSTGQEAYTIAMIIRENFPELANWNCRIIGTDLSRDVVARAQSGRYSQLEVNRGLPATLLVKYFQKEGSEWQIKADVRRMVEFREINLTEPWSTLPPMDIVFMRNVLIYFNVETKKAILAKVRQLLKPGGFLFLGSSETTLNLDDQFEPVPADHTTCYRLR